MESCCNYLRSLCFPKQGPSEGTIYLHSGYLLLSFGPQSVSKLVNLLLCTSSGRQREGQAPMSRNSFEGCNEGRTVCTHVHAFLEKTVLAMAFDLVLKCPEHQ